MNEDPVGTASQMAARQLDAPTQQQLRAGYNSYNNNYSTAGFNQSFGK
jgi:hypothetical protein